MFEFGQKGMVRLDYFLGAALVIIGTACIVAEDLEVIGSLVVGGSRMLLGSFAGLDNTSSDLAV